MLHRPEKQKADGEKQGAGEMKASRLLVARTPTLENQRRNRISRTLSTLPESATTAVPKGEMSGGAMQAAGRIGSKQSESTPSGQHLGLCELDVITREDLQNQLGPKELEALAGSLCILAARTADMAQASRRTGSHVISQKNDGFWSLRISTRMLSVGRQPSRGQVMSQPDDVASSFVSYSSVALYRFPAMGT